MSSLPAANEQVVQSAAAAVQGLNAFLTARRGDSYQDKT